MASWHFFSLAGVKLPNLLFEENTDYCNIQNTSVYYNIQKLYVIKKIKSRQNVYYSKKEIVMDFADRIRELRKLKNYLLMKYLNAVV